MRRVLMMGVLCLALAGAGVAGSHPAKKAAAGMGGQPDGMMAAMHKVQAERIRADVKYLASDALEGRGTGTRGGDLAADYIAKQFKDAGVEPAGDDGSYFQKVPLVGVTTLPETTLSVKTPRQTMKLKLLDDIVVFSLDQQEVSDVNSERGLCRLRHHRSGIFLGRLRGCRREGQSPADAGE